MQLREGCLMNMSLHRNQYSGSWDTHPQPKHSVDAIWVKSGTYVVEKLPYAESYLEAHDSKAHRRWWRRRTGWWRRCPQWGMTTSHTSFYPVSSESQCKHLGYDWNQHNNTSSLIASRWHASVDRMVWLHEGETSKYPTKAIRPIITRHGKLWSSNIGRLDIYLQVCQSFLVEIRWGDAHS